MFATKFCPIIGIPIQSIHHRNHEKSLTRSPRNFFETENNVHGINWVFGISKPPFINFKTYFEFNKYHYLNNNPNYNQAQPVGVPAAIFNDDVPQPVNETITPKFWNVLTTPPKVLERIGKFGVKLIGPLYRQSYFQSKDFKRF